MIVPAGAPPAAEALAYLLSEAFRQADEKRPRTIQKTQGMLGPSDLGFCHQQAVLTIKGTTPSDSTPAWASALGTVIGEMAEKSIKEAFPTWLCGNLDGLRVTVTLPNGAQVSGTPDIIVPEWNLVLDLKTKDGFEVVKRMPWTQNYSYQTWCYATGAVQAGLLDPNRPVYVGLVYLDRSGKIDKPLVDIRELDPGLEDQVNEWVNDVIYAVQHGEDGSQDIPARVCERICEFFTACRGDLPMQDAEPIDHPILLDAIDMYLLSDRMVKAGWTMKEEAREALFGVNGSSQSHTVRWVHVNETRSRQGYDRLDVVPIRSRS